MTSLRQRFGFGPPPLDPGERGRWAEARAAWWYRWRGWRIVARNWRCREGELDVVCVRWRTLCVVEVRCRDTHEMAFASIDDAKMQRTLASGATLVHREKLERYALRYDLISIDARGTVRVRRDILRRTAATV